jgi:uncharacterized protein (TIGR03067 family)
MILLAFLSRLCRPCFLSSAVTVAVLFVNGRACAQERLTLREHPDRVLSVAFAPNGNTLATGCWDGIVRLWRTDSGKELTALRGHGDWVTGVAFNTDGKTLVSAGIDKTIRLWDVTSGKEQSVLRGATAPIFCLALSPDGKRVATGGGKPYESGDPGELLLWQVDGKDPVELKGHKKLVTGVAFSPDGKTLASASHDGTVCLWDGISGKRLGNVLAHDGWAMAVAFSPDGKILASLGHDNKVKLWPLAEVRPAVVLTGHTHEPYALAFAPDGKTLASADNEGNVILWDFGKGAARKSFRAHNTIVYNLAFSPDGKTLATASIDKTVKLWDVDGSSGEQVDKLIGTWQVIKIEFDSKDHSDQLGPMNRLIFGAHKVVMQEQFKAPDIEYRRDTGKRPATIDLIYGPKDTLLGIYEVEGDTLRLCYSVPPGASRPSEFSSKSDNAIVQRYNFVCTRLKPEAIDKPFVSQTGGFQINMPSVPKEKTVKGSVGDHEVEEHLFFVEQEDLTFAASYADYPALLERAAPQTVLEVMCKNWVKGLDGKLETARDFKLGELSARDIACVLTLPDGKAQYGRARMVLDKNRLFHVIVIGKFEKVTSKLADDFIKSFEVAKNPAKASVPKLGNRTGSTPPSPNLTMSKLAAADGIFENDAFVSQVGGFKINMPSKPKATTVKTPTPDGLSEMQLFVVEQGNIAYFVGYSDLPDSRIRDPNAGLNGSVDAILGAGKNTLLSRRDIRLGTFPGKAFEYSTPGADGEPEIVRERIFIVGHRYYQVFVIGTKDKATSKSADAYLESFELIHGPGRPFVSQSGEFRVEMPLTPKEQTIKVAADVGEMQMHVFLADQDDVAYTVAYSDYPSRPLTPDLDSVIRDSVRKVDGVLRSKRDIRLGAIAGSEIEFTMPGPENQVEFARARFFLDNTRLYQLLVRGTEDQVVSKSSDAFFKSFEVINKASGR